jgi:hypothetical protein
MDWAQVVFMFLGNAAIWIPMLIWLKSGQDGMHAEMKDFHGRLCVLEEKYIQMMQRFMEKK